MRWAWKLQLRTLFHVWLRCAFSLRRLVDASHFVLRYCALAFLVYCCFLSLCYTKPMFHSPNSVVTYSSQALARNATSSSGAPGNNVWARTRRQDLGAKVREISNALYR